MLGVAQFSLAKINFAQRSVRRGQVGIERHGFLRGGESVRRFFLSQVHARESSVGASDVAASRRDDGVVFREGWIEFASAIKLLCVQQRRGHGGDGRFRWNASRRGGRCRNG